MELHGEEIEMNHDKGRIVSTRHPPFHMMVLESMNLIITQLHKKI